MSSFDNKHDLEGNIIWVSFINEHISKLFATENLRKRFLLDKFMIVVFCLSSFFRLVVNKHDTGLPPDNNPGL